MKIVGLFKHLKYPRLSHTLTFMKIIGLLKHLKSWLDWTDAKERSHHKTKQHIWFSSSNEIIDFLTVCTYMKSTHADTNYFRRYRRWEPNVFPQTYNIVKVFDLNYEMVFYIYANRYAAQNCKYIEIVLLYYLWSRQDLAQHHVIWSFHGFFFFSIMYYDSTWSYTIFFYHVFYNRNYITSAAIHQFRRNNTLIQYKCCRSDGLAGFSFRGESEK